MKIKVSFVADCKTEGGTVPKDQMIEAIESWLDDMIMGDQVVEYIDDEDFDFDHLEITMETVNVR